MNTTFGGMPGQLCSSPEAERSPSRAARGRGGEWCSRPADHAQHVKKRVWTGQQLVETVKGSKEEHSQHQAEERSRTCTRTRRYRQPENKDIGEKPNMRSACCEDQHIRLPTRGEEVTKTCSAYGEKVSECDKHFKGEGVKKRTRLVV